jgi:hypothetical protein
MTVTMSFKLTETLRDALQDEAGQRGMHTSELVRQVLAGYLAKANKEAR